MSAIEGRRKNVILAVLEKLANTLDVSVDELYDDILMSRIKNNLGWVIFLALSLIPIVFWYLLKPINARFISLTTSLTSLGQITALVGMTMFSLTLILSARLKFLENYFGGLNRVYVTHHIFGSIAFILLLFHPLILAGNSFKFQ